PRAAEGARPGVRARRLMQWGAATPGVESIVPGVADLDESDPDGVLDAMLQATQEAMSARGYVPLRMLLLAECLGPEGQREVAIVPSEDMRAWDVLGLLRYAQAREEAGVDVDD